MIINVTACVCSGQSYTIYLAVEGKKANTQEFNETRIAITVNY